MFSSMRPRVKPPVAAPVPPATGRPPIPHTALLVPFNRRSPLGRLRLSLISHLARLFANRMVQGDRHGATLHFRPVATHRDWQGVCELRLSGYGATIPYMLDVLDAWGQDPYDRRSFVFAIWQDDQAIATIRYTTAPFEVSQYVALGPDPDRFPGLDPAKTVEFSRLLIRPGCELNRLMPALVTYSGLVMMFCTPFRHYVCYAKEAVVRKLSAFNCVLGNISFTIPERGDHLYEFVFGSFAEGAGQLLTRTIRPARLALALKTLLPRQ